MLTSVLSKTSQLVLALFITHTEGVVLSVRCLVVEVFQINPKLAAPFCQAMNLVQPEPKFTIQISKASFVVVPAAIEIYRAVQSLLEHSPSATGCFLVTVHIKGSSIIRVDSVDTTGSQPGFIDLSTIAVDWKTRMQ